MIIERSVDSNRFCFVELSRKLGNLTPSEHLALDGLWKMAKAHAHDSSGNFQTDLAPFYNY